MASAGRSGFHRVFVYGTLKTGEPNHHELTDPTHGGSTLLGTARTRHRFPLVVATTCNIPFLLHKKDLGHEIYGEVYEVDDQMLQFLDQFEECPTVYQRVEVQVILESVLDSAPGGLTPGLLTCYGYVMGRFSASWLDLPHIQSYSAAALPWEYSEKDIDSLESFMKKQLTGAEAMDKWISGTADS